MRAAASVLHVIAGLDASLGGPSSSVPNQCIFTSQNGFRVSIAFVDRGGRLSVEAQDLRRHGVATIPLDPWRSWPGLWRAIADHDIIHINGLWAPLCHWGAYFARLQRKPFVVTPHGMLEPWSLGQKPLKKALGLWLYQRRDLQCATLLQATAAAEAAHFRSLGLMGPIAVIPNGVEIPPAPRKTAPRPGKRRHLLFLSRIHPKKGVLELVRALAACKEALARGSWDVSIAGPDEKGHLKRVKEEAARLGLQDLIEFLGPIDGAAKWVLYRRSDLFVLPTHSENFGLVVAEAVGCGVPVISTQAAPWRELQTKRCGWWHPVGQRDLESALWMALLTPPRALAQMGARGRRLVLRDYAWEARGRELKGIYQWILGRAPMPTFVLEA